MRWPIVLVGVLTTGTAVADEAQDAAPPADPVPPVPFRLDEGPYYHCVIPLPHRSFELALGAAVGTPIDAPGPAHLELHATQRPQLQLDLGLAVVSAAFEHPIGKRIALQVEAGMFSTYFAPWFDAGDKVVGFGGGLRPTVFLAEGGHGWYLAPFVRIARVTGEADGGASGSGVGFSTGAFFGRAFAVARRLDLRIGAGAQYLRYFVETAGGRVGLSTPFVGLDAVVGYRL
jgi:hypothetical protein